MRTVKKISIFYDGKCNLCSKEINYYKKIDEKKKLEFIDVTHEKKKLKKLKINYNDSLMFLHVIDKNGHVHKGVEGFIIIWQELQYWRYLAVFVSFTPVKILVSFFYKIWAKKRYNRLDYKCDL